MKSEKTFEEGCARLELILEKMNSGKVMLEESLALYEEASHLVVSLSSLLNQAEKRVEILLKQRDGALATSPTGEPLKEDFDPFETEKT